MITHRLNLNYKKSKFFQLKVSFLGYEIDERGVHVDEKKISAITNFPIPQNKKKLQQFLEMVSYFRGFIKNFSTLSSDPTEMLKKDVEFEIKEKHLNCFETLKEKMVNLPILNLPDFEHEFIVTTDTSLLGIGASLTQIINDSEHVICYLSRCLKRYEKNYSIYKLEALAVVHALKSWKYYLLNKKFTVVTDNSALSFIKKSKDVNGKMARWTCFLQQFDFEIKHVKGKLNRVADCLSRNPTERLEIINNIEVEEYNNTKEDKIKLILEHHYDLGHAAPRTVYKSLKQRFYWRSMRNDIIETLKLCEECLLFNEDRKNTTYYPVITGEAFERIGIDTMGPFVKTARGK